MKLIKLSAINSTNVFLKDLSVNAALEDFTVVSAENQTAGKGQMGAEWISEGQKNLTFSVYKKFEHVQSTSQFVISMLVSLSVYEALRNLNLNEIQIKWPNDILSCNKKIGGILIENKIKNAQISSSIIGIGINVNQTDFRNIDNASSLLLNYGKTFDREQLLEKIVKQLELNFFRYDLSSKKNINQILETYTKALFRLNILAKFKTVYSDNFEGIIKGVSREGLLIVEIDGQNHQFDLKEISYIY